MTLRLVASTFFAMVFLVAPASVNHDSLWNIANTATGKTRTLALLELANSYKQQDSLLIAENIFKKALDYIGCETRQDTSTLRLCLDGKLGLASIYLLSTADYDNSINLFLSALSISRKLKDSNSEAKIYHYIALNYRLIGKYDKAIEFVDKAITLSGTLKDTSLMISCLNEKSNLLYYQEDHPGCQQIRQVALELAKRSHDELAIGYINHDIGLMAMNENRYKDAIRYFMVNLGLVKKESNPRTACITILNIAVAYTKMNNTDSALHYLLMADSITKKHTLIREQTDVFLQYTDFYLSKGDYKNAYLYLSRYSSAKDTILSIEMNKQIEELDAIYQNEKNQNQIKEQNAALARNELVIKQKNIISFLLSIGIALLLVLAIAILRNLRIKRRANNLLSTKNEEILTQKQQIESANEELMRHRDQLESIVEERTRDLIAAKERAEESDRLKTAFLQNISHEIRTPMNGILGFLSLLREEDLSAEDQELYFTLIKQSSARMINTVTDIMDISKIEAALVQPRYTTTNLSELVRKMVAQFAPDAAIKGVELRWQVLTPGTWDTMIVTDREKVNTIISHLLRNAIKYTEYGAIELGYSQVGNHIQIYVKDSGIGIPDDRLHAIFDRFVQAEVSDTRQHEGSGLGLTISKAYVEMLNGKITVESALGTGSCFTVTIPYLPSGDSSTPAQSPTPPLTGTVKIKKLKIIIAEDDDLNAMYLQSILKPIASYLYLAKNGEDAIALLEQHPDTDLILMDIKMPRMDGYEATRRIREKNSEIIIIVQTAFALAGDRETALEMGVNDYITKPIKKELLLEIIGNFSKFSTEL